MKGRISLLAVVLGLQLLIVAGVLYRDAAEQSAEVALLLEFAVADVDRLDVSGEGESVALQKTDEGWRLDVGAPADSDKINDVLDKLAGLGAPWPVATSEDSRQRFEVTDANHQRRIQGFAGDAPVFDIYLGTSPGYRRVHARVAGADDVYSIDFANYEVPVADDDWLDGELLQPSGVVSSITRDGAWSLVKEGEGWLLTGVAPAADAADEEAADPDAAKRLAERIADLRVLGFADSESVGEEKAALTIQDEAGSYRLVIVHDAEGDGYSIRSNRLEGRFEIAGYLAEQLVVEMEDLRPAGVDVPPASSDADT